MIPTRGDRPMFLEHCKKMMAYQTKKPVMIEIIDSKPVNDNCDITLRYKTAYNSLFYSDIDLIAFIEDDDWYSPEYLEKLSDAWISYGKPDLFGTNYTIYYHIKLRRYFIFQHEQRSSAMNTFIKPGLSFDWPADDDPYTDAHLWGLSNLNKVVFQPDKDYSVGIKHGMTLTGGHFHNSRLHRYDISDPDMRYLASIVDAESLELYKSVAGNIPDVDPSKLNYQH